MHYQHVFESLLLGLISPNLKVCWYFSIIREKEIIEQMN